MKWVGRPANEEEYLKLGITPWVLTWSPSAKTPGVEMNDPKLCKMDFPAGGLMNGRRYRALLCRAPDRSILTADAPRLAQHPGIVIAGGDGKTNQRGFGRTNSAGRLAIRTQLSGRASGAANLHLERRPLTGSQSAKLTMRSPPLAFMSGAAWVEIKKALFAFVSSVPDQSAQLGLGVFT